MKTKQDIYNEMCLGCKNEKKCHDECIGCDEYEDKCLKLSMIERFMPMNEEEQKIFLFMCIDSYFELSEMLKKEKGKHNRRVIEIQMETYAMIINLFNEPADCLKNIGYDSREILTRYAKQKYLEFVEEKPEEIDA